jgi:O-antigen/teichoic acid export membrane protein
MRAPLLKRWPIGLAILVGLVAAKAVSHAFWVQAIVYIAVLIAAAFVLRFAFHWPWRRILRSREPAKP